jgi:uncharacterized protein (DUF952 family)
MTRYIYKICDAAEWDAAIAAGAYHGSEHDRRDGFIHFSTAAQLPGTLARHYAGRENLVLIAFNGDVLGAALKWEPARDGDLFPHFYAPLVTSTALWTKPLPLGDDGRHTLPAEVKP